MHAVELLDEPPSPNSIAVMEEVDQLPPDWRALVYEFGIKIVSDVRPEARSIEEAREMLNYWRTQRQQQWLATNYVSRSMFRKAA